MFQDRFNQLVTDQLETMDRLLFLQSEIERCQELEQELMDLQEMIKVQSLKEDILLKKEELKKIHKIFQRQTEEVIRSYQKEQGELAT